MFALLVQSCRQVWDWLCFTLFCFKLTWWQCLRALFPERPVNNRQFFRLFCGQCSWFRRRHLSRNCRRGSLVRNNSLQLLHDQPERLIFVGALKAIRSWTGHTWNETKLKVNRIRENTLPSWKREPQTAKSEVTSSHSSLFAVERKMSISNSLYSKVLHRSGTLLEN